MRCSLLLGCTRLELTLRASRPSLLASGHAMVHAMGPWAPPQPSPQPSPRFPALLPSPRFPALLPWPRFPPLLACPRPPLLPCPRPPLPSPTSRRCGLLGASVRAVQFLQSPEDRCAMTRLLDLLMKTPTNSVCVYQTPFGMDCNITYIYICIFIYSVHTYIYIYQNV